MAVSRGPFACLLVAVFLFRGGTPATAESRVEIRGRMRLELDRLERGAHGFSVSGVLLDEASLDPMPGHTVVVRVTSLDEAGQQSFAYGNAEPAAQDGGFHFTVPAHAHTRYVIHLLAPGFEGYG